MGSVSAITDGAGAVEVRMSFAAFGRRRNESTWSGNPSGSEWSGITRTTRRGFSGLEMLDNLDLAHMNGRVYDPRAGRFLSADPYIDGASNTQGWNRYAYVKNNPLSAIDPSGFGDEDAATDCQSSSETRSADCGGHSNEGGGASDTPWIGDMDVLGDRITFPDPRYLPIDTSARDIGSGGDRPAGGGGASTVDEMQEEKPAKCWNADLGVSGTAQAILGVSGGSAVGVSYAGDLLNSRLFFKGSS